MGESGGRPPSLARPIPLAHAVVRHALATDVPFMAAAIAYQAFVSLLPLMFLLAVVVATIGDVALTERLLDMVAGQLPADARNLVRGAVRRAVKQTGNTLVGAVLLAFGAFAVFNGLDKAFTDIYGVEQGGTLPNQLRDAALVLTALSAALIAIAVLWRVVTVRGSVPFGGVLQPVALVVGLVIAFYPIFYVFPEVSVEWRETLPGVVLAALSWTVLQELFRLYVRFATRSKAFGVIGGVLLLSAWLYFSGFTLLMGAVLNAVLHDPSPGRSANGRTDHDPAVTGGGDGVSGKR